MKIVVNISVFIIFFFIFFQLIFGGLNQSPHESTLNIWLNHYYLIAELCSIVSIVLFVFVFNSKKIRKDITSSKIICCIILILLVIIVPFHIIILVKYPTDIYGYILLYYDIYIIYALFKKNKKVH